MIVRRWRATAANEKRYVTHFRRRVMPQLGRLAGYRGALLLRSRVETAVELEVLTFWTSMASIRRFVGDNTDKAVVEQEAKAVLRRFDSRVRHFDVVLDALSRTNLPRGAPRR
jgi:heme-degrading monooxygenase HmoA